MGFFSPFLPRAKTENLEEEEAAEANYRKQGAHGIFFFSLPNVLGVLQEEEEEEEEEEEGLGVCCCLSRINTLVEGTFSFLFFTFCLS